MNFLLGLTYHESKWQLSLLKGKHKMRNINGGNKGMYLKQYTSIWVVQYITVLCSANLFKVSTIILMEHNYKEREIFYLTL